VSAPARRGRRVAVVLEQCWHRVPGGTAVAALSSVAALLAHTDLRLVGVAARHASPPPPPFVPTVPVRHLPLPRPLLYESWHRLRRPEVEQATGPVEVIHATGMAVPPRTAPLVVTLNDLAWRHEPDHFTARGRRFFEQCLALAQVEADVVVVPSAATATDVVGAGVDARRVVVVPYAHEARLASEAEVAAVRARHGLPERYVLWVGTVEPRKNLPVVVEAHRRLRRRRPEVGLVLVGPAGWEEDLDAVLGADRSAASVLGFVPAGELAALYRGAEALCYPSLREGFGLPVLEAMAQSTPVVTSAGTSTAEVLGPDGGAGRAVEPTDAAAVADALAEVVEPGRREAMAEAAAARAGEFTWARTAGALAEVYEAAAVGRAVPGAGRWEATGP
jgi:glycosyltransferase involved in cell wall biosynthesis